MDTIYLLSSDGYPESLENGFATNEEEIKNLLIQSQFGVVRESIKVDIRHKVVYYINEWGEEREYSIRVENRVGT